MKQGKKYRAGDIDRDPDADAFVPALLAWFDANRREMPWRGHPDPYAVWVSEIMLQQTQVETVRGYFSRFLATFPDVGALARAETDPLLKAWEGLGYYTRARNLRRAAQVVVERHGGQVPDTAAALEALPGIGPYTAAAVASICFGEAVPVVDGNVARVFARYRGLADDFSKPKARAALAGWLAPAVSVSGRPGDFNQAMMEIGALVCTPRRPVCGECPLATGCLARQDGSQADYPFRPARRAVPERFVAVVLAMDEAGRRLMVRRGESGLLGGLWELPSVAMDGKPVKPAGVRQLFREFHGIDFGRVELVGERIHVFTHFRLKLSVFAAARRVKDGVGGMPEAVFADDPLGLAVATAHRRILESWGGRV